MRSVVGTHGAVGRDGTRSECENNVEGAPNRDGFRNKGALQVASSYT